MFSTFASFILLCFSELSLPYFVSCIAFPHFLRFFVTVGVLCDLDSIFIECTSQPYFSRVITSGKEPLLAALLLYRSAKLRVCLLLSDEPPTTTSNSSLSLPFRDIPLYCAKTVHFVSTAIITCYRSGLSSLSADLALVILSHPFLESHIAAKYKKQFSFIARKAATTHMNVTEWDGEKTTNGLTPVLSPHFFLSSMSSTSFSSSNSNSPSQRVFGPFSGISLSELALLKNISALCPFCRAMGSSIDPFCGSCNARIAMFPDLGLRVTAFLDDNDDNIVSDSLPSLSNHNINRSDGSHAASNATCAIVCASCRFVLSPNVSTTTNAPNSHSFSSPVTSRYRACAVCFSPLYHSITDQVRGDVSLPMPPLAPIISSISQLQLWWSLPSTCLVEWAKTGEPIFIAPPPICLHRASLDRVLSENVAPRKQRKETKVSVTRPIPATVTIGATGTPDTTNTMGMTNTLSITDIPTTEAPRFLQKTQSTSAHPRLSEARLYSGARKPVHPARDDLPVESLDVVPTASPSILTRDKTVQNVPREIELPSVSVSRTSLPRSSGKRLTPRARPNTLPPPPPPPSN